MKFQFLNYQPNVLAFWIHMHKLWWQYDQCFGIKFGETCFIYYVYCSSGINYHFNVYAEYSYSGFRLIMVDYCFPWLCRCEMNIRLLSLTHQLIFFGVVSLSSTSTWLSLPHNLHFGLSQYTVQYVGMVLHNYDTFSNVLSLMAPPPPPPF